MGFKVVPPPWWHKALIELRDGRKRHISEIYSACIETFHEGYESGSVNYFNEAMLEDNPRTGEPRYKKNIQAALVSLTRKGFTERVEHGYYLITDKGQGALKNSMF